MSVGVSGERRVRRKEPQDRHAEMREAAADVALAEGLSRITVRRVAELVGVQPGLLSHYFPSSDDLVAAAFVLVVSRERASVERAAEGVVNPVGALREVLTAYSSPGHDPVGLLWLDAWRAANDRPAVRAAVIEQMEADLASMTSRIKAGVEQGAFVTASPAKAAMRILALLDSGIAACAIRAALSGSTLDYPEVSEMLFSHAEQELGLAPGALHSR